jgi:hypothetical protein
MTRWFQSEGAPSFTIRRQQYGEGLSIYARLWAGNCKLGRQRFSSQARSKTDGGLCVTWPQFLSTPLTVRQPDSFPGCLAIKREACSSLVTSFCISQWIIPGSLLIVIQINLHPAMLHEFVNARPRSEPRGKKHCNQCRAATLKANIPPKRNVARRRSDVLGQLRDKSCYTMLKGVCDSHNRNLAVTLSLARIRDTPATVDKEIRQNPHREFAVSYHHGTPRNSLVDPLISDAVTTGTQLLLT